MNAILIVAGLLHLAFALGELFPWPEPVLLQFASKKLPARPAWSNAQRALVATVVHNAGIYNVILAGGLLWAARGADPSGNVARVLLAGAVLAGVFGTLTMKSPVTALQALVGVVGLYLAR